MPIRFHCTYCDQRLSVSRRKAMSLVKCPTCHQSVQVPTEEVAEQEATLRKERRREERRRTKSSVGGSSVSTAPPPVIEDDEDIEVATPIAALEEMDQGPVDTSPHPSLLNRRDQSINVNYDKVTLPRNYVYAQGALLLVLSVVCFVLGVMTGRNSMGRRVGEPVGPSHVQGNVRFESRGGERLPDDQSVVILLPVDNRPPQSIEVDDIRPTDPKPIEDHPSIAGIRALGGGYSRCEANGEFHIDLPNGGKFYMLVISRNQKQFERPSKQVIAQLGRYFVSPTELIGDRDFRFTEEFFEDTRSLDVVFVE